MIGRLKGTLLEKQVPDILIDVNGVGYELQAPMTTCFALKETGTSATLFTHLSISENAHQLFGFITQRDRELFRLLIKISGVGPKMAIAIMSLESDSFVKCVLDNDVATLVKIPGVGKKTAERLVIEIQDKLKGWVFLDGQPLSHIPEQNDSISASSHWVSEAESALVTLGYKPVEAAKAVSKVYSDETQSAEQLIRDALKSKLPI